MAGCQICARQINPAQIKVKIFCMFQRNLLGAAAAHHAEPGLNIGSQGRGRALSD
jgi:hypothetical protein